MCIRDSDSISYVRVREKTKKSDSGLTHQLVDLAEQPPMLLLLLVQHGHSDFIWSFTPQVTATFQTTASTQFVQAFHIRVASNW